MRAAAQTQNETRHERNSAESDKRQKKPIEERPQLSLEGRKFNGSMGRVRFFSSLEERIETAQQRTYRQDRWRNGVKRGFRHRRVGLVTNGRKSDFFKRNRSKVQNACASGFLFAVDMVDVPFRTP